VLEVEQEKVHRVLVAEPLSMTVVAVAVAVAVAVVVVLNMFVQIVFEVQEMG
jgi:hypothetical protein